MGDMPEKSYSRPRDKSLQAFKDWVNGFAGRLFPGVMDSLTEKEWDKNWKKFWSEAESSKDDAEASDNQE